jgi:hypothetical protein
VQTAPNSKVTNGLIIRWDEWVDDSMILPINDENTRMFQELQTQRKAHARVEEKRAAAAAARAKKRA